MASHLHRGDFFFDRILYSVAAVRHSQRQPAWLSQAIKRLAQLQQIVDAQANVLAFISAFFILGVIVALLVPLPFLMKRPTPEDMAASQGMH